MPQPAQVKVSSDGGDLVARRHPRGWEIEAHQNGTRPGLETEADLMGQLLSAIEAEGGGPVRWRVADPTGAQARVAEANAFDDRRRLVQLRRSLPLPWQTNLETRPFEADSDTSELLRVNNAAFHWHPEQSGWTASDLGEPMSEPWFDPGGLLVHPIEGQLQGFCWTKVHHEYDPPIGEIFVIGVHPDHHGQGLGRALVLAGLDHLSKLGLGEAMLYTETDNAAALGLYASLGFEPHHEIVVFERTIGGSTSDQTPLSNSDPMP